MKASAFLADILTSLLQHVPDISGQGSGNLPIETLCAELMTGTGEVSGIRIAREILSRYREMDDAERIEFYRLLTFEMDIDGPAASSALEAYLASRDARSFAAFVAAAEPKRQEFLRRLNQAPGATAELVRMRSHLISTLAAEPDFERTDHDFLHLFSSWFNRGFLVLRPINWHTPAAILEKIIEYEAVHAISDWDELRQRLEPPDRRCFAFFHPALPDEPLIFVDVALTKSIPSSIQGLLARTRAPISLDEVDTAVFYSISNCQSGLKGVSFGNSLIKQVVEELRHELPDLKSFVTLSPIPDFAKWLRGQAQEGENSAAAKLLKQATEDLQTASPGLRSSAAHFLANAKRADGKPLDSVAKFHLGNGASVHDVHAMADTSANGLKRSFGVMVNYLYDQKDIDRNHERFVRNNEVAVSRNVRALLKTGNIAVG